MRCQSIKLWNRNRIIFKYKAHVADFYRTYVTDYCDVNHAQAYSDKDIDRLVLFIADWVSIIKYYYLQNTRI